MYDLVCRLLSGHMLYVLKIRKLKRVSLMVRWICVMGASLGLHRALIHPASTG